MKLASGPDVEPLIHFKDNGNSIDGLIAYPEGTMSMDQHISDTNIVMIRITEDEYLGSYWTLPIGATCYGLIYVKKVGWV
jgi:hypothetical protein